MTGNISKEKGIWQIQEAKAKFSQVIKNAYEKGYQTITNKGVPIAVILSKKDFDSITQPKNSLIEFFKNAPCQDITLDTKRQKDFPREIDL